MKGFMVRKQHPVIIPSSSRNAYVIDSKTNICYELEPIYI